MFIATNSQPKTRDSSSSNFRYSFGTFAFEKGHLKFATRLAALLTFLFLLVTAFRAGWTRAETDFPNYYTAATLVRQHQPLRNYYDWTWFARQMNYSGNGRQLGAYTPQTPLTMIPMVPLTGFTAQAAKQIWLIFDLVFLGATVWLLSRVTRFSPDTIWLLVFCGYFSLWTNFLYGQYYIFLLFLLTLAFYFLDRNNHSACGLFAGIAFALKLYGGPFLLYFAAKRQWKALIGMTAGVLLLIGVALVLFGPADVRYYATQILPRSLEGGSIDPYNPGVPTFSTLLTRSFVAEPELNPHPLWNAPWLFFFLRSFISLLIVALLFLGTSMRRTSDRHDFAWFVIAVVLLSTSTASYTFVILLLPLVLLLEESGFWGSAFLVVSYLLLTLPLRPTWLFPKVWLLLALFVVVGYQSWRGMSRRITLAAAMFAALISFADAKRHLQSFANEPGQHFERVAVQEGAIFSSFPVVSRAGLFYQSMGKGRYVLRWLHDHRNEELSFEGHALHPRLAPDGESIYFELVANRTSTMMRFDPSTGEVGPRSISVPEDSPASVVSPDGKWMAFESAQNGPSQIWLRDLSNGKERRLTGGNCNSSSPAWELDSKGILFASDCGRAFGLSSLYRAPMTDGNN
ncbi:MAG: glycosyltransferase 87 family protein [Candidatus Acidiferrum sp.]